MNVYFPSWFYLKQHPYCFQGASNLFHSISLMRTHLNNNELEVVKKVVQHNVQLILKTYYCAELWTKIMTTGKFHSKKYF